ncbi:hypothetical protein ES708_27970 [subsurface metagenome]
MDELQRFIEQVHNEPFNLATNSCVHKHVRIVNKARELGHDASLMGCISAIPVTPVGGIPLIGPHFYAKIDGKTVDVSMEPELERVIQRNEDVLRLAPINVSKLRPMYPEEGPPLPSFLPKWPWKEKSNPGLVAPITAAVTAARKLEEKPKEKPKDAGKWRW